MACVICGKKQRLLNVDSVKYDSNNSLPEVLATAIGNKVTSENWNDGSKQICLACNRKCKEFDDLHIRVQDLKDHLLQEYTKRIYKEAKAQSTTDASNEDNVTDKPNDNGKRKANIEISDEGKKRKNAEQDEGEKTQTAECESDKDAEDGQKDTEIEGQNERGNNDKEGDNGKEGDGKGKETGGDSDSNETPVIVIPEVFRPTITMTIKNETEDDSDEEETLQRDWSVSENLLDSVQPTDDPSVEIQSKEVTRLVEKANLRRLPDYEYRQWYSLNGYCYVLHTENNRGQLLTCAARGCNVCCRVTRQSELVKLRGTHTHEPDPRIAERNKLYEKLKERCMSDTATSLITIYEEEAKRFPGGASYLPFPEVRMREWRAANDPTVVVHTNASSLDEVAKKYHCEVCNMGFNSSRLLIRHADKHNQSKTTGRKKLSGAEAFVARGAVTEESKKLRKTLDKKLKRVMSKIKGEESANDTENEGNNKECHKCHETFTTLAELKKHIVSTHQEVLMCVHCDVAFDTPLLLRRHKTSCRKCCDERIINRHNQNMEDDQLAQELSKITGQDLTENMEQDPDDPDWDGGATKGEESTADEDDDEGVPRKKRRNGESNNKPPTCQVCSKTFPNTQQLQTHLYTHASRKKYECTVCGETYNKKAVLTRHMRAENHHGRVKLNPPRIDLACSATHGIRCAWEGSRFECAVCAASFPRQAALLSHMREQKHITDQIIIHEAQPSPRLAEQQRNVKSHLNGHALNRKYITHDDELSNNMNGSIGQGNARRAWHSMSGKRPFECAVCGAGFQHKLRLFAHMENEGHLTDSIVENVPMLQDLNMSIDRTPDKLIVPNNVREDPVQIKQESRVEILSQVIIPPSDVNPKQEIPDEDDNQEQAFYIQAAENADGETVMVIQGDLEGAITENMQLFMDEEGNVVTQDADGNTVQVMQVDLSRMQHLQDEDEQQEYVQALHDHPGAGLFVDGSGQVDEHGNRQGLEQENTQHELEQPEENEETNENQQEMVEENGEYGSLGISSQHSDVHSELLLNQRNEKLSELNAQQEETNEELAETNAQQEEINEQLAEMNEVLTEAKAELSEINTQSEIKAETSLTNVEATPVNEAETEIDTSETTTESTEAGDKTPKHQAEPSTKTVLLTPRMTTRHLSKAESQKAVQAKITTRLRSAKK